MSDKRKKGIGEKELGVGLKEMAGSEGRLWVLTEGRVVRE